MKHFRVLCGMMTLGGSAQAQLDILEASIKTGCTPVDELSFCRTELQSLADIIRFTSFESPSLASLFEIDGVPVDITLERLIQKLEVKFNDCPCIDTCTKLDTCLTKDDMSEVDDSEDLINSLENHIERSEDLKKTLERDLVRLSELNIEDIDPKDYERYMNIAERFQTLYSSMLEL